VEEDVRRVTDLLIAVVSGGVFGLLGGYVFGVLRTLSESRNERRDAALAEIFKEMDLFHRYLGSWANNYDPDPNNPTGESSGIPAKQHVREQYNKFVLVFHGNAIWLGKDAYALIQEFSVASRDFLNELIYMRPRDGVWRLPDGTDPKDRWEGQITPKFKEVRDALREEVEASRGLVAWFQYRIVNRKNGVGRRRTDPGEGE
jgi:hypothetical protein